MWRFLKIFQRRIRKESKTAIGSGEGNASLHNQYCQYRGGLGFRHQDGSDFRSFRVEP